MQGKEPTDAQPGLFVRLGLWGLRSRGALLGYMWGSFAAAVAVAIAWMLLPPGLPAPLRLLTSTVGWLSAFGLVLAGVSYWISLRWADRHGWWSRVR